MNSSETKSQLLPIHVYFKENFKKFLKQTVLNGLKYIEDANRSIWERSYYLISFALVFSAGLYMSMYFLQKWESTPVLVSMSSRVTSVQDVPFPAVTFCNMNQAKASKVDRIEKDTAEYAMLQKICFQNYNYSLFSDFKPRSTEDSIINFIMKKSQNCRDMIIYCKYGSKEETCTDLFREVPLDEGICCVFNQMHPFFLYKGDYEYISDYTSSKGRSSIPVNWNLENGYQNDLPKSFYPRKGAGSGVSMGLTVVLNADVDEYYCSSTNGEGLKVLLYNPLDRPHIKESGLPINLGRQTLIRINPKLMESMPSLREIKPKDRQCYFSNEKKLLFFKYYTKRNCDMECDARQMFKSCNCLKYYMPKIYTNASTCFISESECVAKTERLLLDPETLKCKDKCLPGCHDLTYYPDMFISPFATKDYYLQNPFFRNMSKEDMQNLAYVQIYYRDNFFRGNTKTPYTGLTEFLSQTGGVMSLMVGFGVISIAEIFFFILLKPFIDIFLKRNPKLLSCQDDVKKEVSFLENSKDKFHPQMLFKRRKNIKCVMKWNKNELQKYVNENN